MPSKPSNAIKLDGRVPITRTFDSTTIDNQWVGDLLNTFKADVASFIKGDGPGTQSLIRHKEKKLPTIDKSTPAISIDFVINSQDPPTAILNIRSIRAVKNQSPFARDQSFKS